MGVSRLMNDRGVESPKVKLTKNNDIIGISSRSLLAVIKRLLVEKFWIEDE